MSNLGNKKIFARNLQTLMLRHHKERQNVCEDLNIRYSTFSDWYNGNKYPRIDKIEMLANYFGVEKSDLIEDAANLSQTTKGVRIPVLGRVPAGIPLEAVQEIIDYEEIPAEMAKNGEYFALQIRGDSMEPKISAGDVVIIRKQETVDNGSIALILVNGNDATIKRFHQSESGVKLLPDNPAHHPLFFTPEEIEQLPVRILGKVVELRAKF